MYKRGDSCLQFVSKVPCSRFWVDKIRILCSLQKARACATVTPGCFMVDPKGLFLEAFENPTGPKPLP